MQFPDLYLGPFVNPVQETVSEIKLTGKSRRVAKRKYRDNLKQMPLKFSFKEIFDVFKDFKNHNYKAFGKDWFAPKDDIFTFDGLLLTPDSSRYKQFLNQRQKEFMSYANFRLDEVHRIQKAERRLKKQERKREKSVLKVDKPDPQMNVNSQVALIRAQFANDLITSSPMTRDKGKQVVRNFEHNYTSAPTDLSLKDNNHIFRSDSNLLEQSRKHSAFIHAMHNPTGDSSLFSFSGSLTSPSASHFTTPPPTPVLSKRTRIFSEKFADSNRVVTVSGAPPSPTEFPTVTDTSIPHNPFSHISQYLIIISNRVDHSQSYRIYTGELRNK